MIVGRDTGASMSLKSYEPQSRQCLKTSVMVS